MTDDTSTTPPDRPTTSPPSTASTNDWGAAPTPVATSTLDVPASAPSGPYAAHDPYAAGNPYQAPAPGPGSWQQSGPYGVTPWYGAAATPKRKGGPKPPWFWPVIAAAVGLAALLAGGGIGFAVGHAIGGSGQSTTQVPGTDGGTNQYPGGGTGQFPGNGTQGGTGTGTGTGSDSSTSGSAANS